MASAFWNEAFFQRFTVWKNGEVILSLLFIFVRRVHVSLRVVWGFRSQDARVVFARGLSGSGRVGAVFSFERQMCNTFEWRSPSSPVTSPHILMAFFSQPVQKRCKNRCFAGPPSAISASMATVTEPVLWWRESGWISVQEHARQANVVSPHPPLPWPWLGFNDSREWTDGQIYHVEQFCSPHIYTHQPAANSTLKRPRPETVAVNTLSTLAYSEAHTNTD